MTERPTQHDIVHAHGKLKRRGGEWSGPCPLCGGVDRFYVRANGWFYCRHCLPDGRNTARYTEMRKALGLEWTPDQTFRRPKSATPRTPPPYDTAMEARALAILRDSELTTHPYLANKGFPEQEVLVHAFPPAARFMPGVTALVLPVRDARNRIISLQLIAPNGTKRFLPGSTVRGGRFHMGHRAWTRRRWYVEGFATALSLRAALAAISWHDPVIVAFSAHNLAQLAAADPRAFVIADNDASGVGESAARSTGRPHWTPPERGDLNDHHMAHGLEAVVQHVRTLVRTTT